MTKLMVCVIVLAGCGKDRDAAPAPKPAKPAKPIAPTAPADPRAIGSPLPEVGPHPDYPTPVGAGTDKIFLLEEPDRGPPVQLDFKLPTGRMTETTHASCEVDAVGLACAAARTASAPRWRVRRDGKQRVVAHELRRDGAVVRTLVYLAAPDGTPRRRVTLDAYGRVQSERRFADGGGSYTGRDRDGSNALEGCGSMAYQVDDRGQLAELRCRQWTGEPMHDTNGVAITRYVRDASGIVVEEVRLGLDGAPLVANDGVHRVRYELDDHGAVARTRYEGTDATPAQESRGCHGYVYERDRHGAVTSVGCVDAEGKPAASVQGPATTRYAYDARGCVVATSSFAPDGKPTADLHGVHGRRDEVDARCASTAQTCVGLDDKPRACGPAEAARRVRARDPFGRITSTKHYAPDGKAGGDPDYGAFEVRATFDDRDRQLTEACFDPQGRAADCSGTGFHAWVSTYDDAGRVVEQRYLDTAGKPGTNLGTALRRTRFDNYDHEYETAEYGRDGRPVLTLGKGTRRNLYDRSHRLFGILLLDTKGRPATYTGCFTGATCGDHHWHAARIVRRPDGTAATALFFDTRGQLVDKVDCTKHACFD